MSLQRETQERNFNIFRLRSFLPYLKHLLPDDVVAALPKEEVTNFYKTANKILVALDRVKKTIAICDSCSRDLENVRRVKTKKSSQELGNFKCDICGESDFINPNCIKVYKRI